MSVSPRNTAAKAIRHAITPSDRISAGVRRDIKKLRQTALVSILI